MWEIHRTEEIAGWIKSLDNDARQAILLIGGDKRGVKGFYKKIVPLADDLYDKILISRKVKNEKDRKK